MTDNPNPAPEPLITHVPVTLGEMMSRRRPVPRADQATIYLDANGRYHHATQQVPLGGVMGFRELFLVDMSVFSRQFELRLPSREQAFYFTAKVTVRWRITDPVEAVKTNLVDAAPILLPHVERVLRDISVMFPIDDSTGAERAITYAFSDGRRKVQLTQGVSVLGCVAALTLDDATIAHVTKRTEDARAHVVKTDGLLREGIEQTAQQRIDLMNRQHELAMKQLEEEYKLKLERQRMEFFSGAVAQDPNNLIGIMLSQSPERAPEVIDMLMKRHRMDLDDARELVEVMLKHGLVARSDVTGIVDRATTLLTGRMTNAPFAVEPTTASAPVLPAAPAASLEPTLTAEVVSDSSKPLFEPLDDDEEDDDEEDDL
ncbi:hypothetical protein F4560_007746 [Saccharothrix ecbatanensis]|uniref:Uncharacterized protein n=1 Tax=Saccharothrix ecbatanensis TaxID=1105145 RepID=A0A7W9HT55_9PSEU|nr:hypothetical protein [Saccharothrix ecbatanensis]MBB5807978.1 hypothetical protein [Saccharothrix ecbatanensis]